jgi:hypothetical protein
VWEFLKTVYVIPPTRGRTGGVAFRIDLGLVVDGAQREKEEPSLEEGSGLPSILGTIPVTEIRGSVNFFIFIYTALLQVR